MPEPTLPPGYTFREVDRANMDAILLAHARQAFGNEGQHYRYTEALSADELSRGEALRANLGTPFRYHLALYQGEEVVGWSWGQQDGADTFYMVNSAVLQAHRGRGLYRALVDAVVARVSAEGFQRIYSRHVATNNAVIVPKLKAGFVISGLELSDQYGLLVHLTYMPHPLRRKVLAYRAGELKPDAELVTRFGLDALRPAADETADGSAT